MVGCPQASSASRAFEHFRALVARLTDAGIVIIRLLEIRGLRRRVEIPALVLKHDKQVVLPVASPALDAGAPTKAQILNVRADQSKAKPRFTSLTAALDAQRR